MGKRMGEYRRRRTLQVGSKNKDGVLGTPNGYHGRSQKGCFGGTPGFAVSGMFYSKNLEESGKTVKEYFKK